MAKRNRKQLNNNNWGNVAVGVRVGKHPEAMFFRCWTALLLGGLRGGDTVLMPECYMPAHQAANKLARQFLAGERDSLLLIDDDMAFPADALDRLRSNPTGGQYDIVFGFCTHRTAPKPVILKLKENQPTGPERANGEVYERLYQWADGDVVPVDAVGLAFTLIRKRVFEALIDPELGAMYTPFFSYGTGNESDEISFCRNARNLGFRMAVDTAVHIDHLGVRPMGWTDYVELINGARLRANGAPPSTSGTSEHVDYHLSEDQFKTILLAAADSDGEGGRIALDLLGGPQ